MFAGGASLVEPIHSTAVIVTKSKTGWEAFMRTIGGLLLLVATMTITPAFAYTDEQVQACTPDVMRLCAEAIPDQARITQGMIQKKKQVSATCLQVMKKGPATSRVAGR
jgi:hypothetical protein